MEENHRVAQLLGRMLDLVRRSPDEFDDLKAAVSGLLSLAKQKSRVLRIDDRHLYVDEEPVPPDTSSVPQLRECMSGHRIAEIQVDRRTSAVDLMHLLHALAVDPRQVAGYDVAGRLRAAEVATITIVSPKLEQTRRERQAVRVTDALKAVGVDPSEPVEDEPDRVSAAESLKQSQQVRPLRASSSTLASTVAHLEGVTLGPKLMGQLEGVQHAVQSAIRGGRIEHAVDALTAILRKEADAPTDESRRAFAITLRRILTMEALEQLAPHLLDDLYRADVLHILRRAGVQGTKILMTRLVKAPTYAERRTYISAIKQIEEGAEVVASMLDHHEWFVVRNAADLAGELKSEAAVPRLGQALDHEDARVRRSAGIALAKIGTAGAAAFLRKVLHDPDRTTRLEVARAIHGRELGGLVMTLVTALEKEEDESVQAEYYRALGRIGTPEAVRVLAEVARPGGMILGRRAIGPRLAATEGLALAGGEEARDALQELSRDRTTEVREVAQKALRETLT